MIFDTHCHLQMKDYEDHEKELKTMEELGVGLATLIGSDFEGTNEALELAKDHENLYVVAGIMHPIEAPLVEDLEVEKQKVIGQIESNRSRIVGIGEAGLDYFHLDPFRSIEEKVQQKEVFRGNIELAERFSLPLIIHIRDAWEDGYNILKTSGFSGNVVIHCYTSDLENARRFLSLSDNVYIGFSGIVTFKNGKSVQEAAGNIPLEKILVETDAPFLAPEPYRGKQNTPGYTRFVLDKIKSLRSEDPEMIEDTIYQNSLKFYSITPGKQS